MSRKTSLVELVETHNIALSLKRIGNNLNHKSWRRALVHALGISAVAGDDTQKRIREALDLP